MPAARTEHDAGRPSWDCRVCGQPWPCANAKVDLVEEYEQSRTMLILFMAACLAEAIDDLSAGGASPADLYDRFLNWVRPAMSNPAAGSSRGGSRPC